jgi:hypothetical protein
MFFSSKNRTSSSVLQALFSTGALVAALGPVGCVLETTSDNADGDPVDGDLAESQQALGQNLALGKPTSQSSTYTGSYASAASSSAVDGNTSGNWSDQSVTHTNYEPQAWWQVDLQSSQAIGTVVLSNRTDCCSDRLSNFNLLVSDDGSAWQSYPYAGTAPAQVTFAVNRTARYVKVQLNGTNVLSLAEVQVFPLTTNLALGKPTSQSSTYTGSYASAASSSAVDGNTSGNWFDQSVTHTNYEPQAWWQVDLQSSQAIGTVVLSNRTDCCSDRLSNFNLLVSDDGSAWQSYPYAGTAPAQVTFAVNRTARYVKVQLNGTNVLSLAEVQVFAGCAEGQVTLDGTSCVTLTPWPHRTDLPAGSKIAIRLRRVMTNYYGGSVEWPKWIGVSTADNVTIDAVDVALTSRNVFTATTFHPAGQQYYDLPWYNMLASNGMYVGGSNNGSGKLVASYDLPNAGLFGRGWNGSQASQFLIEPYPWSQAQSWLDQVKANGNYYVLCQSPFTLGTPHITQWLCGPAPNYGCYVSADVDYFIVN